MSEGPTHPEGWYPDPGGPGMERWWDGERWTERVRPGGWAPPPGGQATPAWGQQAPGWGQQAPGWGQQAPGSGQREGAWQPAGQPPPNHLVWAILTTIFCCLPFGIVSIVKSSQVNSKWAAGDVEGARQASASARTWAIVSAVVAPAVFVLLIISITFLGDEASRTFEESDSLCLQDPAYC